MGQAIRFRCAGWGPWLGGIPAALVVLPPVLWLAVAWLRSGVAGPAGWTSPLLQRSLLLAGLVTLASLALGTPAGWWLARDPRFRRRWIGAVPFWPLLLPPYVLTLAWIMLLSREGPLAGALAHLGLSAPEWARSLPLAAWILTSSGWALTAWFVRNAACSIPREWEEAARLELPDRLAALWCARPLIGAGLRAAGLLVFLLTLCEFGAPNALGLPTYPVEIVSRFQLDRDAAGAIRFAAPLLALLAPLALLLSHWLNHAPRPSGVLGAGSGSNDRPGALGRMALGVLVGLTLLLPLGMLGMASLPPSTYRAVWDESVDPIVNTLVTGLGAGLGTALLALLTGWRQRNAAGRVVLDALWTLPLAFPASLIAIAMVQILNRPGPLEWCYTSQAGLIWTHAVLFYPYAHWVLRPAWSRVDPEVLDELAVQGAGSWQTFRVAGWPVAAPYAVGAAALTLLLSSREMDAAALLRIPGGDTVAFRIHDYLHFSPGPNVAALSILLFFLSAAILAGAHRLLTGNGKEDDSGAG